MRYTHWLFYCFGERRGEERRGEGRGEGVAGCEAVHPSICIIQKPKLTAVVRDAAGVDYLLCAWTMFMIDVLYVVSRIEDEL